MSAGIRREESKICTGRADLKNLRFAAAFRGYDRYKRTGGKWIKMPVVGTAYFSEQDLGAGIVAHEMLHAALQFPNALKNIGKRRGKFAGGKFASDAEENLCYLVGELVRSFWETFYKGTEDAVQSKKSKRRISGKITARSKVKANK